jgi:predicted amidophosphoribosyltransferase
MELHPQKLIGHWTDGYALDFHTVSSKPIEYAKKMVEEKNPFTGEMVKFEITDRDKVLKWDTTYTAIGLELNHLKYWEENERVNIIAHEASTFLKSKTEWNIDLIIPIPPSNTARVFQPVDELAKAIGTICNLPVDFNSLKKLKSTSQLKDIEDPIKRQEILKDAFDIAPYAFNGKNVLLFDDLYRSGETLNAVCHIIKNKGTSKNVYVLTISKTRSKK